MVWATSDRAARLPPNWASLRMQVRRRARGRCEATAHATGCNGIGAEADHVNPGDDHSLTNLMWLSPVCHRAKTAAETAERNRQRASMRRRPSESHPGAIRSN